MEEMITIPKKDYEKLLKYKQYVKNYGGYSTVECRKCGTLHPDGYLCPECGWDNNF